MELYDNSLTIDVMRFETTHTTELNFIMSSHGARMAFKQKLTADQCEALARALIDAAADLRAAAGQHWPFPGPNGATPWTPAQIAAHATQQRASAGEALL